MINKKLGLCITVFMGLGLIGLQAQSYLSVEENSGSNSTFYTNNIRKLTFSGGDMDVAKLDGSSSSYAISGIRKLDFTGISTDIQISQQIEKTREATKLYPNPVKNILYIESNFDEECELSMEVLNLQGNVLLKETIVSTNNINVSDLQKGMYICRIHTCDKIENIKFLKQ